MCSKATSGSNDILLIVFILSFFWDKLSRNSIWIAIIMWHIKTILTIALFGTVAEDYTQANEDVSMKKKYEWSMKLLLNWKQNFKSFNVCLLRCWKETAIKPRIVAHKRVCRRILTLSAQFNKNTGVHNYVFEVWWPSHYQSDSDFFFWHKIRMSSPPFYLFRERSIAHCSHKTKNGKKSAVLTQYLHCWCQSRTQCCQHSSFSSQTRWARSPAFLSSGALFVRIVLLSTLTVLIFLFITVLST